MRPVRPGLASLLAVAAVDASLVVHRPPRRGMTDVVVMDEVTRLTPKPQRRYIVQTPEQRAWNEAVDARNAAKKAGRK